MRTLMTLALLSALAPPALAASTPRQDALVAGYFAIWDDDSHVTFDNVAQLYAPRIDYYGHSMTREDLLRDKLDFIRRWPSRHYGVEPGSAAKRCDAGGSPCVISAVLVWRTSGPSGTHVGRSRVRLTLARQDGGLKIVREGAAKLQP